MDTISPMPDAGAATTIVDVTTESFMADVVKPQPQLVLLVVGAMVRAVQAVDAPA